MGLFALQPFAAGERVIGYKGEVTGWRRAAARQRSEVGHTFVFGLSDGRAIDGSRGGNSGRFLNHACAPNCEAIETGERVFIHALAAITPGKELFIDYGLLVDGAVTDDIRTQCKCHCGASGCRRTMLGNKAESG
ncbi:SET domain-containing protein [Paraburkholderia youngii]